MSVDEKFQPIFYGKRIEQWGILKLSEIFHLEESEGDSGLGVTKCGGGDEVWSVKHEIN